MDELDVRIIHVQKRILFVCHSNICRSPMAEFILKKLVQDEGGAVSGEGYIPVDSSRRLSSQSTSPYFGMASDPYCLQNR